MGIIKDLVIGAAAQTAIEKVASSKPVQALSAFADGIQEHQKDRYYRNLNKIYDAIRENTTSLQYPYKLSLFRVGDLSDVRMINDYDDKDGPPPPDVKKKTFVVRNEKDELVYRAELDSPLNKVTIESSDGKRKALIKRKNVKLVWNGDYLFSIKVSGKDIGSVSFSRKNQQFDYLYNDWHILLPSGIKKANLQDKYSLRRIHVISDKEGEIGEISTSLLGISFAYRIPEIEFPMVVACFILELWSNQYTLNI